MLINVLQDIGLSEKESFVYLACLKLGTSKVSDISSESKINRVTCYDILEKLMEKQFISQVNKDGTQVFIAADPDSVLKNLEKKHDKFKSHVNILKNLSVIKSPLKISYFEGADELKKIYFDTLDSKTEILNIINEDAILPIWPNYETDYVQARILKKIYLRGIAINTERSRDLQQKDYNFYRQVILVSKGKFDFSNDIMIYDEKVAILSWLSLGGVIIDNKDIAETHRALFEMAWGMGSKSS